MKIYGLEDIKVQITGAEERKGLSIIPTSQQRDIIHQQETGVETEKEV